tara:strand:- start:2308 stop:3078 length:771 start_codon:yes stop_codon:yes gene_type:complete
VQARKRFGQHFLHDVVVLQNIVEAISLSEGDKLFEVGPGRGALTDFLYGENLSSYKAVEIDRDLVQMLSVRYPNIELVQGDILKLPFENLLEAGPWRVVGNLPYNITTPLVTRLFNFLGLIEDMHFMLQKEVAERMCASPGTKQWGRLSVLTQFYCEIEELFPVAPESFSPIPKVDSSFLRFIPRKRKPELLDTENLSEILRKAFSGRRKKISNSLKSLNLDWGKIPFPQDLRADQLTVEHYVLLANQIEKKGDHD